MYWAIACDTKPTRIAPSTAYSNIAASSPSYSCVTHQISSSTPQWSKVRWISTLDDRWSSAPCTGTWRNTTTRVPLRPSKLSETSRLGVTTWWLSNGIYLPPLHTNSSFHHQQTSRLHLGQRGFGVRGIAEVRSCDDRRAFLPLRIRNWNEKRQSMETERLSGYSQVRYHICTPHYISTKAVFDELVLLNLYSIVSYQFSWEWIHGGSGQDLGPISGVRLQEQCPSYPYLWEHGR